MRRTATWLFVLGIGIGAVGTIGMALGFQPSRLPAELIDISVYKLIFVAAVAIIGAGAFVRRAARRDALADEVRALRAHDEYGDVASRAADRDRERLPLE